MTPTPSTRAFRTGVLCALLAARAEAAQVVSRTPLETLAQGPLEVVVSEDGAHYAYAARVGDEVVWIWNGRRAGPAGGEAALSRDGARFAFLHPADGGVRLNVDLVPRGDYASAQELEFSPDGAHLAYIATPRDGGVSARVFRDGKAGPPLESACCLQFAPDGERLAYVGTGSQDLADVSGSRRTAHFGDDGRRASDARAWDGADSKQPTNLYLDHRPIRPLPPGSSALFSRDWKRLAHWTGEHSWGAQGGAVRLDDALLVSLPWCRVTDMAFGPSGSVAFVSQCHGSKSSQAYSGKEALGPPFVGKNRHDKPILRIPEFADKTLWFGDNRLFVNGREAGRWGKIYTNLALSPSGGRTAFVAACEAGPCLVVDGRETDVSPKLLREARVAFDGEERLRYLEHDGGRVLLTTVELGPG